MKTVNIDSNAQTNLNLKPEDPGNLSSRSRNGTLHKSKLSKSDDSEDVNIQFQPYAGYVKNKPEDNRYEI